MHKSRHILMVTLVATALCADTVAQAAPELRPQVHQMATRIVRRLSISFRQVVPAAPMLQSHRDGASQSPMQPRMISQDRAWPTQAFSPFEFRLPPPVI